MMGSHPKQTGSHPMPLKRWLQGELDKGRRQASTVAGSSPPAHAASHTASVVLARTADGAWRLCHAAVSGAAAARLVDTTHGARFAETDFTIHLRIREEKQFKMSFPVPGQYAASTGPAPPMLGRFKEVYRNDTLIFSKTQE